MLQMKESKEGWRSFSDARIVRSATPTTHSWRLLIRADGSGMRPRIPAAALSLAPLIVAVIGSARGCSSSLDIDNPFVKPDPVVQMRAATTPAPRRAVVVVGAFENPPQSPLPWTDIGNGFADVLSDALLSRAAFQVQIHGGLSGRVASAVLRPLPDSERAAILAAARREFPDVDYVIVGRVDEFHHSADVLPVEARRSFLGGSRNRAVVTTQAVIVDVRTGRIVHQERLSAAADAPELPTARQYAHMSMTSPLFATSPLGKACADVAGQIVGRLDILAPVRVLEMQVIRAGAGREVIANGGSANGVSVGQRYFVCRRDVVTDSLSVVRDDALRTDLLAEVIHTDERTCTLWLIGEPPAAVMLSQCVLTRERP